MPRIDESRPFVPVRIAVMTVSDTRDAGDDMGPAQQQAEPVEQHAPVERSVNVHEAKPLTERRAALSRFHEAGRATRSCHDA